MERIPPVFTIGVPDFQFSVMDSGADELHRKLAESQKLIEKQNQEIKELELKLFEKSSVS
jgi:hypothetical protein